MGLIPAAATLTLSSPSPWVRFRNLSQFEMAAVTVFVQNNRLHGRPPWLTRLKTIRESKQWANVAQAAAATESVRTDGVAVGRILGSHNDWFNPAT